MEQAGVHQAGTDMLQSYFARPGVVCQGAAEEVREHRKQAALLWDTLASLLQVCAHHGSLIRPMARLGSLQKASITHSATGDVQDRGVRQEALMLLVNSLAAVTPAPSTASKRVAFSSHLEAARRSPCSSWRLQYIFEVLRLFCEQNPAEVASVIDHYAPQVSPAS